MAKLRYLLAASAFTGLLSCPTLAEIEYNRIGVTVGVTEDAFEDDTQELRQGQILFQAGFESHEDPDLIPDIEIGYGRLETGNDELNFGKFGFGLRHVHNWPLEFRIGAGVVYLDKINLHSPEDDGLNATYRFGGEWQFNINAALTVNLNDAIEIGYRFDHFSNGERYEDNSGLNTHSIAIFIPLGM